MKTEVDHPETKELTEIQSDVVNASELFLSSGSTRKLLHGPEQQELEGFPSFTVVSLSQLTDQMCSLIADKERVEVPRRFVRPGREYR